MRTAELFLLCRLTVTATSKENGAKVASETFNVALVGAVEVSSAVLAVKRLDPASTKQKEELEYPQQLQKPLALQPGTQLRVCKISASLSLSPLHVSHDHFILRRYLRPSTERCLVHDL